LDSLHHKLLQSPLCANFFLVATCKLTVVPTMPLSQAPLGFNASCLCTPETYREQAPSCIDCLFRGRLEEDFRDTLLSGLRGCADTLQQPVCPKSCRGFDAMMEQCEKEDALRTLQPAPEVVGAISNTTITVSGIAAAISETVPTHSQANSTKRYVFRAPILRNITDSIVQFLGQEQAWQRGLY